MYSQTMDEMLDISVAHDGRKRDMVAHPSYMEFDERGDLFVGDLFNRAGSLALTPWAAQQVCDWLKTPWSYLRRCPGELRAQNWNSWLRAQERERLVRAYGGVCRAVLSNEYSPVASSKIIKGAMTLVDDMPYKLVRSYVTPDILYLKIAMDGRQGGDGIGPLYIGCFIMNGEIGNRRLVVAPFVQRTSCENSVMYVDGGISQVHRHLSQERILYLLTTGIAEALHVADDMVDNMLRASREQMPQLRQVVEALRRQRDLPDSIEGDILIGSEGHKSLLGLTYGVSYAAHANPDISDDARIDLECLAGELLMGGADDLFERAARAHYQELDIA
jgi:hypothetical protein